MQTQAPQKNKRLSQGDRDSLLRYALKCVKETQDTSALDASYDAAAQAVHDALVAEYPQRDMAVLAKYEAAASDACVFVSSGERYRYDRFEFRAGDKRIPLRPGGNCNRVPFMLEGAARDAYDDYALALKAHDQAIQKRYDDFKALIVAAKSFNEVADVWPQAEWLRSAIVGTSSALVILSNEVVERIKADAACELEAA